MNLALVFLERAQECFLVNTKFALVLGRLNLEEIKQTISCQNCRSQVYSQNISNLVLNINVEYKDIKNRKGRKE